MRDVPMLVFFILLVAFGAWFTASLLAALAKALR